MSAAAQSAWKPPDTDRQQQAWTPPAADRSAETPSALHRLSSAFWEGIGGKALTDIALGGTALDPEVRKKGMDTIKSLVNGIKGEPARMWDELTQAGQSMLGAHPVDTAAHIAKAVPFVGAGAANVQHDFENGDYATGFGHALALLLPFAVKGGAVSSAVESVPRVAGAVAEGAKAAAPDVAAGAGKVAAGALASEMLPGGPLKYVAGAAPVYAGARQIGRGLSKGFEAGKASLADRISAATEAMAGPDEAILKFSGLSADESKGLKPEEQLAIRNLAANAQPSAPSTTPSTPPASAPPVAPTAPAAPQTIAEMIQAEIAARNPQLPGRTPLRPPLARPAPPPPESATVPPANAPRVPLSPPVGPAPPQSLAEAVALPPAQMAPQPPVRYLFHGTSSNYLDSINKEGLRTSSSWFPSKGSGQGRVYMSPFPEIAADEASNTVYGDEATETIGRGGEPALIVIDRSKLKGYGLTRDREMSSNLSDIGSLHTDQDIPKDAIVAVHSGAKAIKDAVSLYAPDTALAAWKSGRGPKPPSSLAEAVAPPPARTLAQTEAAMAQKAPAPLEPPTSQYTSTGEKKSPELRAAEITGSNVAAKAQRFIQALHDAGVTSSDARSIPVGRLSLKQIEEGGVPGWGNVTDDLVSKGILKAGENPPSQSIPEIVKGLKKLEAQKIAAELADEMKRSGTIK